MKKKHLLNLMIGSLSISSVVMVSVITSCGSKDPEKHEQYTKKTDIGNNIMKKGATIDANIYENDSFKYVFDAALFPSSNRASWETKFVKNLNNTLLEWGPGNFFNKLNGQKSTIIFKKSDAEYSMGGSYLEVMIAIDTKAWTDKNVDANIEINTGLVFHEVGHQNNAYAYPYYNLINMGNIIKNNGISISSDFSSKILVPGEGPNTRLNEQPSQDDIAYATKLFGSNSDYMEGIEIYKNQPRIENENYVKSFLEIATRIMESTSYVNGSNYTYTTPIALPAREPMFVKHWFDVEIFTPDTGNLNIGYKEFVEENLGFYAQQPVAQLSAYSMSNYYGTSSDQYAYIAFNSRNDHIGRIEVTEPQKPTKTYNQDILNSKINLPIKDKANSIKEYSIDSWNYSAIRVPYTSGSAVRYVPYDQDGNLIPIQTTPTVSHSSQAP